MSGKLRPPAPRLLPLTIGMLALVLGERSVGLVRAASGTSVVSAAVAAERPLPLRPPPARAEAAHPRPTPSSAPPPAPGPSPAAAVPPPTEPPVSEAERVLLQELRARRSALDAREAALAAREDALAAAEKRVGARVDELSALQGRLEALEAARRERDETGWRGLVRTYEAMRPRDAAAIFNELDAPVLLQVLDRMKEAKAAPVLAAMQPERARLATAQLAAMRARANTPEGG